MFNIFKKNKIIATNNKLNTNLLKILIGKKTIDADLEIQLKSLLISSDMSMTTIEKVLTSIKKKAKYKELNEVSGLYDLVKTELMALLITNNELSVNNEKTFVILVVGVNGVGKTTTIAKIAKFLQNQGKTIMIAAGDTFRAAAIKQIKTWGEKHNILVTAKETGSDSAAVIFDAYNSAVAKKIDVLIADTAGRLHTQANLMLELQKVKKVLAKNNSNAPHETMLVIDGTTGQNALNQAVAFNEQIGIDGITITKLDGSSKGGMIFTISDKLKIPIRYIGIGEKINDLEVFNVTKFSSSIFSN